MKRETFSIYITPRSGESYDVQVDCPAGQGSLTTKLESQRRWLNAANTLILGQGDVWRSGDLDRVAEEVRQKMEASDDWHPQSMGEALFREIFTGEIQALFLMSRGMAGRSGSSLAIELHLDFTDPVQAKLAVLPWELLFDPQGKEFLALGQAGSVVRFLRCNRPARRELLPEVLDVLVVTASPKDETKLDVKAGAELISGWKRPKVRVRRLLDPDRETLRDALRDGVHVLHFEGHGRIDFVTGLGEIALVGRDGRAEWLPGTELASWLLHRPSLRLVVLNACSTGADIGKRAFSGTAAALVRGGVPAVVAMRRPIDDGHAVRFARELYGRLMDGKPLEAALASARHELKISASDSDAWSIPSLLLHTEDVFHVPADDRPAMTRIFSWLGVVTGSLAVNGWLKSQGGPQLPGLSFASVHPQSVSPLALLSVAPLLILMLYVLKRYQLGARERGLLHRFPIAFGVPVGTNRITAYFYQGIIFFFLVFVPVASQIHFMHKLYKQEVWANQKPDYKVFSKGIGHWTHFAKPGSLEDGYRIGPDPTNEQEDCSKVQTCSITFFPGLQPWVYTVLVCWILVQFISVTLGIWSREPWRWRNVLPERNDYRSRAGGVP